MCRKSLSEEIEERALGGREIDFSAKRRWNTICSASLAQFCCKHTGLLLPAAGVLCAATCAHKLPRLHPQKFACPILLVFVAGFAAVCLISASGRLLWRLAVCCAVWLALFSNRLLHRARDPVSSQRSLTRLRSVCAAIYDPPRNSARSIDD